MMRIAIALATVFAVSPALAGEHVLFNFDSPNARANGALVRDSHGTLYGTTRQDGAFGRGTVYKLDRDGTRTVLHDFKGAGDGAQPMAGLTRDADGNLYGTTWYGGGPANLGAVFKLKPNGAFTLLHAFNARGDGANPAGELLRDAAGNLYGTTRNGGTSNYGTVFKIAADGTYSLLHQFAGGMGGSKPLGGMIADGAGNLYGTTQAGGQWQFGTVYKLAPDGQQRVLASFEGGNRGFPSYGLVADASGNLYGVTINGTGTVFKVMPDGKKITLHSFSAKTDGTRPEGSLIIDAQGNLYGTTMFFGGGKGDQRDAECCGAVFKMTPDGTTTVLHVFQGGNDGAWPVGALVADKKGALYGTTYRGGGEVDGGTIFKVIP